jgi:LysM repeat protein
MRLKFYNIIIIFLAFGSVQPLFAQAKKMTRAEYILKYKTLAIRQMKVSGIPASIIMAQACLESDNGNSQLAVKANNHFGIKCHKSWDGKTIHHDDDAKHECFRKYDNPERSFYDHSDFLRYRDRYAFLFELSSTDYKAWAHGLKKAGYATNPQYAHLLIKIIEENNLQELDKGIVAEVLPPAKIEKEQTTTIDIDNYKFTLTRKHFKRNGVKYIMARKNETYDDIAMETGVKVKNLERFNDMKNHKLETDEVVYIQRKKPKTVSSIPLHIAGQGETMQSISQRFAVRLSYLYKYNDMKPGEEPEPEQEVFLRKKKREH